MAVTACPVFLLFRKGTYLVPSSGLLNLLKLKCNFADHHCKMEGAERMAYPPIVASGSEACIIHYSRNDKVPRHISVAAQESSEVTSIQPFKPAFVIFLHALPLCMSIGHMPVFCTEQQQNWDIGPSLHMHAAWWAGLCCMPYSHTMLKACTLHFGSATAVMLARCAGFGCRAFD